MTAFWSVPVTRSGLRTARQSLTGAGAALEISSSWPGCACRRRAGVDREDGRPLGCPRYTPCRHPPSCSLPDRDRKNYSSSRRCAPNSTGMTATIWVSGSLSVAANTFTRTAQGAVQRQFAPFFYGPQQTQLPHGDGCRCIGAGGVGVFRLGPPQQIAGDGSLTHAVDCGAAPMNTGGEWLSPGPPGTSRCGTAKQRQVAARART